MLFQKEAFLSILLKSIGSRTEFSFLDQPSH